MKITLPSILKPYEKLARDWLQKGYVKDVEFSGSTYQVLVADPKTKSEDWAFLQIDNKENLKDSFCSCAEDDDVDGCVHRAVGWLYIFGSGSGKPLHQRFEKSLWNILCQYYCDEYGCDLDLINSKKKGEYVIQSQDKSIPFQANGLTTDGKERLEFIFSEERAETEETSLKFSGLSPEELDMWHQGKPTALLAYELSFWGDLAKWLMSMQERKITYKITFTGSKKALPDGITVSFKDVEIHWALTPALLLKIIPTLNAVTSPLKVFPAKETAATRVGYDPDGRCFIVLKGTSKKRSPAAEDSIPVGEGWVYIPTVGFMEKHPFVDPDPELMGNVTKMLDEYHGILTKCLIDTPIDDDAPHELSYSLSFDDQWNLHIDPYVFEEGDLSKKGAFVASSWAYIPKRGFLRIKTDREFKRVVPEADVVGFVTENRLWVNHHKGFHLHLNPVRTELDYTVDDKGNLSFAPHQLTDSDGHKVKDFGRLVYFQGQGFFAKETSYDFLRVRPHQNINASRVSSFIREHCDELVEIPHFFYMKSPFSSIGLRVHLQEDEETIEVSPDYQFLEKFQKVNPIFYDDFVYLPKKGFYEIPAAQRLPEPYRSSHVISGNDREQFLHEELQKLTRFITSMDPKLKVPKQTKIVIKDIGREEALGVYHLKCVLKTDIGEVPLPTIWWALHHHKHFLFSTAGSLDFKSKRWLWLKDLSKENVDRRSMVMRLNAWQLLRLNALEEIVVDDHGKEVPIQQHSLFKNLFTNSVDTAPDISGLCCELRPYQTLGVRWLWFLYTNALSGLLCDDMGLGKTHQAMALMAGVHNLKQQSGNKAKFLVICPTSVLYHWQEKLKAFLPDYRVLTYYGNTRSIKDLSSPYDILLTSYGIWRNDSEHLGKLEFDIAIIDELHMAKNQSTRVYSSLVGIRARMRLGLTGTPIENRLRELKSLFDLIMPSYLPSETEFRNLFINPIEKGSSIEAKHLLSRLIRPFVLRRKKEDVLIDLPEKIEEISHCDLSPDQRKMYIELLTKNRDKLIEELKDEHAPIPYIHIFGLLTHLKQICNHPASFLKAPDEYTKHNSGKWDLFIELLEEARESQQKVVVFSHYLSMMDIIENYLTKENIGFAGIRGATVNRGEQLQKFEKDPSCEVFVASLQAAGLGIDLTAASVVIHYDRWWNQSRENQATDRVHRIGQKRGVQVFKLVTKGTIEEHIDALITKKGRLMEEIVGVDDQEVIKTLDRQEIIALLQALPE